MRHLFGTLLLTAIATFVNAQSVGVNTPNPHSSAILDVSSTTKGMLVPRMTTAQRTAIPSPALGLLVFDTDLKQFVFSADTGWVKIPAGNPATGTGSWTVNGENQYSALTGKVGIGTDSATNKLHVVGGTRIDGRLGIRTAQPGSLGEDLAYPAIESVSDNSNESDLNMVLIESNGYSPWLNFGKARGTQQNLSKVLDGDNLLTIYGHGYDSTGFKAAGGIELKVSGNTGEGNIPTAMLFATSDSGTASPLNRMVIDQKGNVGIGNMLPTARLDVAGKTKTDELQMVTGSANGYLLQSDANGNASWVDPAALGASPWTGSGSNAYLTQTSGNVGIGNNNPLYKFTVGGQMIIGGAEPIAVFNAAGNKPVVIADTSLAKGVMIGYDGNDIQGRGGADLGGNSHLVLNQYGGNVGIGTNAPAEKLDVAGKTKTAALQMTNGASAGHILQSDASGNATWVSPSTLGGGTNTWTANGTNQYSALAGNVGVGTNTPTEKLEVAGKTKTTNLQLTAGANSGYVLQSDADGNANWVNTNTLAIAYNETDPKIAAANNNTVPHWNGTKLVDGAIKDDSTNVGIGTAPVAANKLTVSGKTATTSLQITAGANNGYVLQSDAAGNAAWVNSTSLPNANWTTSGSNQFSALIGNVGIGTNSPTTKLEVAGTAKVTNFQMSTGATTGYVLRSDAVGNASWVNTNTLTVNETDPQVASSTSTRVPKWSGTALVDGLIQDDGVGIGINTAPTTATALTVNGKTSTSSLQITTGAVSGYVLRSNGATGNAVWVDPATLPITYTETDPKVGTLTTNLIPRWNGTALTNTQVFDNGTATGIATTTPLSVLDVNGAMGLKVRGTLTSSSTNPDNTASIWIYTTNSGPITLPAANTCANRMYCIANRTITPILMNPATTYIGLTGAPATNIVASSVIWIVSDGTNWQQIR